MKLTLFAALAAPLAALVLAGPAAAQEMHWNPSPSPHSPADSASPAYTAERPSRQMEFEQQAELPAQPAPQAQPQPRKKHPGTVLKLRGAFMDAPVVEGDQYPESSLGYPEAKKPAR